MDQLDANGSFVESSSHYYINDVEKDRDDLEDISNELTLDIVDGTFRTLHLLAVLTRAGTSGNEFSVSYLLDSVFCSYSGKSIDVSIETNSTSMGITVESGYSLYIERTQYTTGSTYPNN